MSHRIYLFQAKLSTLSNKPHLFSNASAKLKSAKQHLSKCLRKRNVSNIHYSLDYLKFGFITAPANDQLPMCLICRVVPSNEAMKPSRPKDHLTKKHQNKVNENLDFFMKLKNRIVKRSTAGVAGLLKKKET